jgi:hypothetical protein
MRLDPKPVAALALALALPAPLAAQAVPTAPTDSAVVNLVRLLVEQGVISRDKGAALVAQAEAEAAAVRRAQGATPPALAAAPALPAAPAGAIRVPHVPETVRAQIREEVKTEVLATARAEGWAAPGNAAPDWTRRITLYGDMRLRSQSELFARGNSDQIFDFATINEIGGFDLNFSPQLPTLNSRIDRWNRFLIRARLGVDIQVSERVKAAFLLSTGVDDGPISTNDVLGGGFGKRDFWLQEAYVDVRPTDWAGVMIGRIPNPFTSTELLFDEDLSFDGAAVRFDTGTRLGETAAITVRGGAFPLDFGSPDYPVFEPTKRRFDEKWLFSGQIEGRARVADQVDVSLAVAYHSFLNVQGELSEPCNLFLGVLECSTDARAPFFLRKGNTVSPLRFIPDDPALPPGEVQFRPQLVGYTFDFDILDVNARARFPVAGPIGVTVTGNYLRNLSFRRSDICRNGTAGQPLNNGAPDEGFNFCAPENPTRFAGGRNGYLLSLDVGHQRVTKWGEWSAEIGYRHLESDAVPDAFTDSDFHLGGTNARGFVIGARTGLFPGMSLRSRFLSANEVAGEPLGIDVLQFDLEVEF